MLFKHTVGSGCQAQHYHCDNGRFADNGWMADAAQRGQTISFCGINAHHQNGLAKKAIRGLQEQARKSLLHAKARWPQAIHTSLWPYALCMACYVYNILPTSPSNIQSRLKKFIRAQVAPSLKHTHTFGCPVFALQSAFAAGKAIPKWDARARLGVYLRPSPRHAQSVVLVLNLSTGLVSSQYHVIFDDFFETTQFNRAEAQLPSAWQKFAGFNHED